MEAANGRSGAFQHIRASRWAAPISASQPRRRQLGVGKSMIALRITEKAIMAIPALPSTPG
jgi:hypothetical protein